MNNRKLEFTILSAIAMILVMLGHLDYDVLTFVGIFPYYSYHVMIFVFVSGYFYKPESEENIGKFIWHKFLRLMVPYYIWNVIYGLIAMLLHGYGFSIGEDISVWNLLVAPFVGGHQFMYNATAWFVPALFALEVCNVIGRKMLSLIHIRNEWVIMALYLAMGCFAVYMAKRGSVYDYYKFPGRLLLMAPCLQMGRVYRDKLEKYDTVPSWIMIPLLFAMNLILVKTHGGLAYSVVWVTGFANTIFTPFITALTGIALWLRVSKLLARMIGDLADSNLVKRFVEYFGAHTYDVMMHQLIVFMGIKEIMFLLYKAGASACQGFDEVLYRSDVYYTFVPGDVQTFKWVYVIVGVVVSLLVGLIISKVKMIR